MHTASEAFDFETAAKYRDYINAAGFLTSQRKIVEFTEENKNLAMIENLNDSIVKFFLIQSSKVIFSEKYDLKLLNLHELKTILSKTILHQLKLSNSVSRESIGRDEIDEAQIIYSYLKSSGCRYIIISEQLLENNNAANLNMAVESLLSQAN
jgi:excinuclease ABC subunit C